MTHFHSYDPLTGSVRWSGDGASALHLQESLTRAQAAQTDWRRRSQEDRLEVALKLQKVLEDKKVDLARWISWETGKPLWESMTEAAGCIGKIKATIAAWQTHDQRFVGVLDNASVSYRSLGVVAVLGPFNFPCHLPNGQMLPALLAGNAVLFKPSERTPGCGDFLHACYMQAGFPADLCQIVHGDASVGQGLVTSPEIDAVFFTGSRRAGVAIHQSLAGRPEVLLALELGGNNPLVVWNPERIAEAVRLIVLSAYSTAGQRCTCARRLIVPTGNEGDAIIGELATAIDGIQVGAWDAEPQPFMGAVLDDGMRLGAANYMKELVDHGAVVVREMSSDGHDKLLRPGLIDVTTVSKELRVDEEYFVPLLQVVRCDNFDAAIAEANATRYGLSAALISRHKELWQQFSSDVHAGIINWNRQTTGASGQLPFGGCKASGNHRAAGIDMIQACSDPVSSLAFDHIPDLADVPGLH